MSTCKKEDGETREWVPRKKKAGLGFPQVLTQIRGSFEILMKALGLYIKRGLEIYVLKQTKPKKKKLQFPKPVHRLDYQSLWIPGSEPLIQQNGREKNNSVYLSLGNWRIVGTANRPGQLGRLSRG